MQVVNQTQDVAKNKLITGLLDVYVQEVKTEFGKIDKERKELLKKVAHYVGLRLEEDGQLALTFICTHNSRRSHLAQIWAQVAACHYSVKGISCYSGGTEATAFYPAAIQAVEKTGIKVMTLSEDKNPVYAVKYCTNSHPVMCYSKKYDSTFNPQGGYTAIMTCSNADKNCPFIPEASARFAVKYEDPKISDGTPEQADVYDERCRQIAREMLYLFSHVKG